MVDYTAKSGEEKKRSGCLTFLIALIIIIALVGLGAYLYLPKALSSITSGGALSRLLPDELKMQTEQLDYMIRQNMDQLWATGISPDQALDVIDELDYKKAEDIMDDISLEAPSNTTELIELVSSHIDLTSMDLDKIKRNYYSEFSADELTAGINRLRESPLIAQMGFRTIKETLKNVIEEESWTYESEDTLIEETPEPTTESSNSSSSTTKKKK